MQGVCKESEREAAFLLDKRKMKEREVATWDVSTLCAAM